MLWTPESQKPLNEEMTPFKWELTSTRKHRTAFIHLLQYVSSSLFYRISFILSIVYQMFFLQCFLQSQVRPWKWVWNTLEGLQKFPSLPEEFWLASSLRLFLWYVFDGKINLLLFIIAVSQKCLCLAYYLITV